MAESLILTDRPQSPADAAKWTCPHDRHAQHGCVSCYQASTYADSALPQWNVSVWFTITKPIPIRALQDVYRHDRCFSLDQPSTPLVYLLSGRVRAGSGTEAAAGVAGFLLQNRHIVQEFTVTEIRAFHS
ncbi:hypothetical protein [Spongiactinospora sp. TRM90649]|uniref:hypothetical protein n=1 Tax=Spongiactinospora sp. TRM90649 TaxID=3031114 RepID=UPI0023F62F14|nr:hypothetical protein [Spongiactinospora sp. TRM90649]MDF5755097.1 hypothetical protein [Spongiactinospora sp. TRM90649]